MRGWIGRTLGKVTVEFLLARGGMAEVYLGRHSTLERPVVVKVLNNQYENEPEVLARFQREARTIAMLRHPNIVQVHDFDSIEGHPYLIMEYVPGTSLGAHMRALHARGDRLGLPQIDTLLTPVAAALQYAHGRGAIHRDVKPGNILLTSPSEPVEAGKPLPPDAQPVLTDFGLVRFLNSATETSAGQVAGTPAYMSPEQARGQAVDPRTDIYSLGVVAYELLADRTPFEADTTTAVLQQHINEPPPPIPDLPQPLQRIMDRVLAKNPAERFQTPNDFVGALHTAIYQAAAPTLADVSATESTPIDFQATQPALASRWSRVSPGFIAVAVLVLAGFVGLRSLLSGQNAPAASATMDMSSAAAAPGSGADSPQLGVLRFQDGSAMVDEVSLTVSKMPSPSAGSQYEAWLVAEGGEELRSLGYLALGADGSGTVTFVDPQGRNLLAVYDKVEITQEPDPDPSPNPSDIISFSSQLPSEGLLHVRHLLVSFPGTPGGVGLLDGLLKDATLVNESSQQLLNAFQSGDEAGTRRAAEAILNLSVGKQSDDYKDWDSDGVITDPGDGYGLLLNGDNTGYVQGSFSHADYAATTPDATPNMKLHGDHVKICAQNLSQWVPQLRDLMRQILASPFGPAMGPTIRQAVALSDEILKGTDLDGNEKVEPIPGEGGALTAYQHAYYMADMVITAQK